MATHYTAYSVAAMALAISEQDVERIAKQDTDLQLHAALDHLADLTRAVKRVLSAREIDAAHDDGHADYNYTHFAPETFYMITLLGQATGIAISTARTTRAAEKVHASVLKDTTRATPDVKRELQFAANNLRNALGEIEMALEAISDANRSTR